MTRELHDLRQAYQAMLKNGRSLRETTPGSASVRVGLLCEHAPQLLSDILVAALAERGLETSLYVADYDSAPLETHSAESDLYQANPEIVIYSMAMQKYRDRFYRAPPVVRASLPETAAANAFAIIDALCAKGITVIVCNLALPIERQFGNFAILTNSSLFGSVMRLNLLLAEGVSDRRGCHLNDTMYLSSNVGSKAFLDERLWHSGKYPYANEYLPLVARSLAGIIAVKKGQVTKALVLDLDNTMWGGVIGDDGMDGIALGGDAYGEAFVHFQRYILSLRDRGYILAVCSKNNEDVAIEVFRSHPEMAIRETDISVFVANWNNKASNIEYIARVLNIGLDSMIFIDDSAFERDLVKTQLPMVHVPDLPEDVSEYVRCIEESGLLDALGETKDDADRNSRYREEAIRTKEQVKYDSIDEYLGSLNMASQCGPFQTRDMARIAQLFQRSNQFNFRTQRLSQAECERLVDSGEVTVSARLADSFGDYGLISAIACEAEGEYLFVKEFVMSCRVLKRGVEDFLMNHLFSECRAAGLKGIEGEIIPSAKNKMVADFYRDFEFELVSENEGVTRWRLDVKNYQTRSNFITGASND